MNFASPSTSNGGVIRKCEFMDNGNNLKIPGKTCIIFKQIKIYYCYFFFAATQFNVEPLKSSSNEKLNYKYIQSSIEALIPNIKAHIYGSHRYGLADDNSDLNIYIEFSKYYSRFPSTYFKQLKKKLFS